MIYETQIDCDKNKLDSFFDSLYQEPRIQTLNLHIHLGKKDNQDVSYLLELREQRYLLSWDLYL
jgi:gamma-glutamyl:cysteine ligase YbdK (ATP-grasp superfamily)